DLPARHAQQLFALSADLLVVVDADQRIVAVNPSWERVLGYKREDLVGTPLRDLRHPDDWERSEAAVKDVIAGEPMPGFENRFRHADGRYVWLRWSAAADHDGGYIYASARDITEERQAIEDARAATRRLEEAQRVAKVGSWEQDMRTGERNYTPEMFVIQGMDPDTDEPWGLDELLSRVVPEHHHRIHEAIQRMYAGPGVQEVEYHMHSPGIRVIRTLMELIRDADGAPVRLRGTTQDITELRQNERRLAEAERVAGLGSFEWRLSDSRVVWSEGTYPLFNRDPELGPLDDDSFWTSMLPEEVDRVRAALDHAAVSGEPWELEYSVAAPGGGRRILLSRGETFGVGDDTYVRGTIQDVTRHRRATRQQQEIARLGQLALAGTDLRALFDEVCRVTIEVLGTDMVTILALQSDNSFALAANLGFPRSQRGGGTAIPPDRDSVVRHALRADAPLLVPDWHEEDRYPYPSILRDAGVRCTMVLPIRGRDAPFGALLTHTTTPGVDDPAGNVAFLDALGSFLATAIERARHETEIAALATLRGRLVAENLEAEERVRQRISEQLHDGALQDLLAARQDLVEAAAEGGDPAMRDEMLGFAREGVERAVKLLREAVHALHPVVLQHGGLEAAMRAAADQAARQGGFHAEVTVDPAATGLRDELVMSLARELLNNAAKHAEAEHVHVTVGRVDGTVLLEVADDGRGLDADAVAAAPMHGHIGLASLTQRVEAVGGTLDLRGAPAGGGTTVVARLPIG
ncbi:MAG TPA: PAS domain-containing protein, partial [Baekduia sp.]|nr:PAS domain-containing protein [Baekduia sp.]